jgi:hypothetical protein
VPLFECNSADAGCRAGPRDVIGPCSGSTAGRPKYRIPDTGRARNCRRSGIRVPFTLVEPDVLLTEIHCQHASQNDVGIISGRAFVAGSKLDPAARNAGDAPHCRHWRERLRTTWFAPLRTFAVLRRARHYPGPLALSLCLSATVPRRSFREHQERCQKQQHCAG